MMKPNPSPPGKKRVIKPSYILVGVLLLAMIGVTIACFPWFAHLATDEGRLALQKQLDSFGAAGVLLLLGIQVLQVVVALIPGEPVELIAGVMYGTWGGLALCLSGCLLAQPSYSFWCGGLLPAGECICKRTSNQQAEIFTG